MVDVYEAKSKLSELVRDAEAGKKVVISRRGRAVVQLVPVKHNRAEKLGMDRGLIEIAPDFDELPESVLRDFDGH